MSFPTATADRASVRSGDLLFAIGARRMTTASDVRDIIAELTAGMDAKLPTRWQRTRWQRRLRVPRRAAVTMSGG